ncbi:hypothetical protein [Oerskovia enterophila]|uniref:Lactococcin 972 family bacteriocin n=1 Tax=Oerskovia enterophila TaxID=43678 RepID=A0A163PW24_9CELL|nr:hypothetical protein [Oerskovia enterophila]KZM33564.1 hypothetical protein OJAG_38840 [Oerskovia enterophila]OCI29744.1 hypothetical protein OERS_35670 [Oerskovia enterophila]
MHRKSAGGAIGLLMAAALIFVPAGSASAVTISGTGDCPGGRFQVTTGTSKSFVGVNSGGTYKSASTSNGSIATAKARSGVAGAVRWSVSNNLTTNPGWSYTCSV